MLEGLYGKEWQGGGMCLKSCSCDFTAFMKTGPCGVTREGEEERLFRWKSRVLEIVKRGTKLSQTLHNGHYRSCLVNLSSSFVSLHSHSLLMFLKGQKDFWKFWETSGAQLRTYQCSNSQWDYSYCLEPFCSGGQSLISQCNMQDNPTSCVCEIPWRSSGDPAELQSIFI